MAIISSLEKENVDEVALAIYESFKKDSGKVPEWVKVMAHNSAILKNFVGLFFAIMKQGELDPLLKWKIGYVVSENLKCKFCVSVSLKMLKSLGASEEMIEKVKKGEDENKDVLDLVRDVTDDANLENPELINKLKEKFSEKQLVEMVSIIGLFNYMNRFNNTLAIHPD